MTIGLMALAAGLSGWFLVRFAAVGPSLLKSAVKVASVGCLAIAAGLEGSWGLAVALGLGAAGDLALSRPGQTALILGMAAFGAAHGVYVWLLVRLGDGLPPSLPAIAMLVFSLGMAVRLWQRAGVLRWAVMAYIGLIAAMGLAALSAMDVVPLATLAAGLFILSDALLSEELFGSGRASPRWRSYAVWASYWSAQFLFLVAFLRISHLNL